MLDEEMIGIIALYFTKEFSSGYEPAQLLLGAGIGIIMAVILIKKIISRKNKTWQMNYFTSYQVNQLLKRGLPDDV